jgi:hypothetical protein
MTDEQRLNMRVGWVGEPDPKTGDVKFGYLYRAFTVPGDSPRRDKFHALLCDAMNRGLMVTFTTDGQRVFDLSLAR